jgi:hypothetical protein
MNPNHACQVLRGEGERAPVLSSFVVSLVGRCASKREGQTDDKTQDGEQNGIEVVLFEVKLAHYRKHRDVNGNEEQGKCHHCRGHQPQDSSQAQNFGFTDMARRSRASERRMEPSNGGHGFSVLSVPNLAKKVFTTDDGQEEEAYKIVIEAQFRFLLARLRSHRLQRDS